jgi:hypothetical protein
MEFTEGKRIVLTGSRGQMRHVMHYLPTRFYHEGKRVLVVDTINSLNPHHPFFNDQNQENYFDSIYCVRTPLPYDLWARLGTSGKFIKNKKIKVLLITSLSLIFKDMPIEEVEPMLSNILRRIDSLTQRQNLITVIANSPYEEDDSVMLASSILSAESNVLEVEA